MCHDSKNMKQLKYNSLAEDDDNDDTTTTTTET